MKNTRKDEVGYPGLRKSVRRIKMISLLHLGVVCVTSASDYSNSFKVSIDKQNSSIIEIFREIEDKSDFTFFFADNHINVNAKTSVKAKDASLETVLNHVLKNTGYRYEIVDKQVLIKSGANSTGLQQTTKITGSIVDETGEPIVGANVVVKGTTNGVISDLDGKFALTVAPGSELVVSYIGYTTQQIKVGKTSVFKIILKEDTEILDEVVVVGYGTQKKVNLTGAVESVDVSKTKGRAYTNASAMLQGNVSGAFISQKSGQPGNDDATINIRGIGTFGNSSPLVIIDGMEGSLGSINPKDIESISVLKDAASCAIYGNRASNGVVLIKTKSGEYDKMNIEYNGLYGVQKVTSLPNVLTGVDYLELQAEAYRNTMGSNPNWYTEEYMSLYRNHADEYMYPTNYNWLDDTYQAAPMTDHFLSITGGGKLLKYSTSVGYLYQDGIVKGNSSNKFTFRTNVSSSFLNDKLKINASISTQYKTVDDLVDGATSAIYGSYVAPPTIRMYIPGVGYSNHGFSYGARAEGGFNKTKEVPLTLNGSIDFSPLKGLNLRVYGGMDRGTWENKRFVPRVQLFSLQDDGTVVTPKPRMSDLTQNKSESQTFVFNAIATYNKTIKKDHDLSTTLGYEMREYSYNSQYMYVQDLIVNLPQFSLGDAQTMRNSSGASELAWLSYFGRLNYGYKSKYLFEFNLRYDGSSRFIDKWGVFPSFSGAWRVSEEAFLKNKEWLNNLKLRMSWGRLGNESIGQSYAASDELSLNGKYNFNNYLVSAAYTSKLANRKTSWETSEQYNVGLDIDVINKISASLEYYIKDASDILMQVPVSSTLGMSTDPYQNAGKMRNKGFEIKVRYNDKFDKVGFFADASASYIKNEVKNLAGKDELVKGNTIWRVGESFNSLYGLMTEGIYQNQSEIDNHLVFKNNGVDVNPYYGMTPVPGDIRFVDQITVDTDGDGIPDARDGVIDDKDRVLLGQTFPKWTFSGTVGFNWNNFDFSVFMQGVAGIKALNQGMITTPFFGGSANTGDWYLNRWTPENPSKTMQRLYSDPKRAELISEYYMEDASYLRCKSLDLGYTIPNNLLRKFLSYGSSIRVYMSFQNLFTITGMRYKFDPEKPTTVTNTLQYPQSRIYSVGVNIKL